ncbi:MAG: S8 family serine peptidase, partial [Planctomycetes bacterium]|nr:S8 family serine peptidase [Planctomycetota bacterium]
AAGNERQGSRCNVEGFGDYYSTAPPSGGKNHITVGALNSNDDSVTSFTSWGPVNDGRLKPDISGPGCQSNGDGTVTSCSSSGDTAYTGKCGTSMACPTVTGLAALLLQDFRTQFPTEPDFRNSTLKAFFAHTAQDIQNPGPDYQTGYGSVRIQPAIDLMRAGNFTEETISQGETFLALVFVSPDDAEMKVTLAWDDLPGTPNVDPALVNDLDLIVRDPSGAVHHPWTLDPLNPSAPAVQNRPDHLNNIEQVFAASPMPGAWQIEVSGLNVALGIQPFSLTVSPLLVNCSTQGFITLDRVKYGCESVATLQVVDCDLNTDDNVVETISVSIVSDTEPGGEIVLLTETADRTAVFRGSIPLSETDAAGTLRILEGSVITATYIDADDGNGNFDVTVEATATVDCQPPVVSNVQATEIEPRSAVITFNVNEPVLGTIRYGTSCALLSDVASGGGFQTAHSIRLNGLTDDTDYYFAVDVADEADNTATDDNGGNCYTFRTLDVPDFFTEQFGGGFDLANWSIGFTPDGSFDFYRGCGDAITALPTDPTGGTPISLSDDSSSLVSVTGGQSVSLYGTNYTSFHVGSNGYITFGSGDSDWTESLSDHFSQPRISAMFDDLNPAAGGSVSWLQLADRAAVTYQNVPEFGTSNSNTFQIELFFDGRIQISYLSMDVGDGIVGLSAGGGLSPDFLQTDLSGQESCQGPDCNNNGIPDDMDISGGLSQDCNGNEIPDECDIADGTSPDDDGNGVPDECELEAPLVEAQGARYLAITPQGSPSQMPVALRVTGDSRNPTVSCVSLYVQGGQTPGLLGETPVFQTPNAWGTVHAHGAAVIPLTFYTVQAELPGGLVSGGTSATTWHWCDVNNDGDAGFLDILEMVHGFKEDFSGATLEAMDQDPCTPDRDVDFLDMLDGVRAFKDQLFADKGCPAICP